MNWLLSRYRNLGVIASFECMIECLFASRTMLGYCNIKRRSWTFCYLPLCDYFILAMVAYWWDEDGNVSLLHDLFPVLSKVKIRKTNIIFHSPVVQSGVWLVVHTQIFWKSQNGVGVFTPSRSWKLYYTPRMYLLFYFH